MKDAIFIIGLIVVIFIALKVFFWAVKTVLILAVVLAIAYGVLRSIGIIRAARRE